MVALRWLACGFLFLSVILLAGCPGGGSSGGGAAAASAATLAGGKVYRFSVATLDNAMGETATMSIQDQAAYTFGNEATAAQVKAKLATPTGLTDAVNWGTAFTTTGGTAASMAKPVTLQAAYDTSNVYLLASWTDASATQSIMKERWSFDGAAWSKGAPSGADASAVTVADNWDEDRLAIWWDISGLTGVGTNTTGLFSEKGCAVLCHLTANRMGTEQAGAEADLWHWKAARTEPVGFSEDQRLKDDTKNNVVGRFRNNDSGTGFESANKNAAGTLPAKMSATDPAGNASFLVDVQGTWQAPVAFNAAAAWANGASIPGFTLTPPHGGRADIKAVGAWAAGAWSLIFTRRLTTNHADDDVQFTGLATGTTYPFGVAVLNNEVGSVTTMGDQDATARTLGKAGSGAWLEAVLETPTSAATFTGAAKVTVPTGAGTEVVTLKAAYDANYIYILATWPDAAASEAKEKWTFDGAAWTRTAATVNDEDRLAIWWDISGLRGTTSGGNTFATSGCNALCHLGANRMGTEEAGAKADLWHWKAARTNPLRFSEDQRLKDDTRNAVVGRFRNDDTGTGFESANKNAAGTAPTYQGSGQPATATTFLVNVQANSQRAVDFVNAGFANGNVIPGFTLQPPWGGRGDIKTSSSYAAGVWKVMFTRPLTTLDKSEDAQY